MFMPGPQERCVNCEGAGRDPRKRKRKCPTCLGKGVVEVMEEFWFDVLKDNVELGFKTVTPPLVKAPWPSIKEEMDE